MMMKPKRPGGLRLSGEEFKFLLFANLRLDTDRLDTQFYKPVELLEDR